MLTQKEKDRILMKISERYAKMWDIHEHVWKSGGCWWQGAILMAISDTESLVQESVKEILEFIREVGGEDGDVLLIEEKIKESFNQHIKPQKKTRGKTERYSLNYDAINKATEKNE